MVAKERFIPACAGSSKEPRHPVTLEPVHPRVRGEQIRKAILWVAVAGSSPRARGAAQFGPSCRTQKRFIPACAGSRRLTFNQFLTLSVHPRVRGEQLTHRSLKLVTCGSSPRARGADLMDIIDLNGFFKP